MRNCSRKNMRNILICTVGTSFLNNLKRADESVQEAVTNQNWQQIVLFLLTQKNSNRICGAEVNSITSIFEKGLLESRKHLILLVSETPDGKNTGDVLKRYYEHSANPLRFDTVEVRVLTGLRDDSVTAFCQEGLKNLVREVSHEVRKFSSEAIAINATGGYKAQISFAGMIGQALDIPVYYLFERFSEVIELPPQPVALDLGFWLSHYHIFEAIEAEEAIQKTELEVFDGIEDVVSQRFASLIDEVEIDNLPYLSLSAMGVLFHERARLHFARQEATLLSLVPQTDTPTKKEENFYTRRSRKRYSSRICQ